MADRPSGTGGGIPPDLAAFMNSMQEEELAVQELMAASPETSLLANTMQAINFLTSLGPNGLASLGEDYEFDPERSYATYLVDQGVPWGVAGVLGTAMDFAEPGPGEFFKAGAALGAVTELLGQAAKRSLQRGADPAVLGLLPGIPREIQTMVAEGLNPNLLDERGFPLQQFRGEGQNRFDPTPGVTNFEGHGHSGLFTTPSPAYAENYAGRYIKGLNNAYDGFGTFRNADGMVLGLTGLPQNPVVVPGSLRGAAGDVFLPDNKQVSDLVHEYVQLRHDLTSGSYSGQPTWLIPVPAGAPQHPLIGAEFQAQTDALRQQLLSDLSSGRLNAATFTNDLAQARKASHSRGIVNSRRVPDSLTSIQTSLGYDGHVDMRSPFNAEVAMYQPRYDSDSYNIATNVLRAGGGPHQQLNDAISYLMLGRGANAEDVIDALRSPRPNLIDAGRAQMDTLDALRNNNLTASPYQAMYSERGQGAGGWLQGEEWMEEVMRRMFAYGNRPGQVPRNPDWSVRFAPQPSLGLDEQVLKDLTGRVHTLDMLRNY